VFVVEAYGTGDSVAEIGQQFAWLGSALRSSPYDNGISYCTPSISPIYSALQPLDMTSSWPEIICKINFTVQKEEVQYDPDNGQCWHNMFRNPVVVRGYPILRRSEQNTGLEIPLNMMARLAQTKLANIFNGKLFIKGFSIMLIPTKHARDLVIWHLLYNKYGNRISYLENTVPHAENVSIFDLEKNRHILGWCSEVKTYAGR
jgi:hypothetical protein